jgi:hypothetical protein
MVYLYPLFSLPVSGASPPVIEISALYEVFSSELMEAARGELVFFVNHILHFKRF